MFFIFYFDDEIIKVSLPFLFFYKNGKTRKLASKDNTQDPEGIEQEIDNETERCLIFKAAQIQLR